MIKYKLRCKSIYCSKENEFEAWFQNIESYEKQKKLGLLSCPTCGGEDVIKLLTTPNLNKLSVYNFYPGHIAFLQRMLMFQQ